MILFNFFFFFFYRFKYGYRWTNPAMFFILTNLFFFSLRENFTFILLLSGGCAMAPNVKSITFFRLLLFLCLTNSVVTVPLTCSGVEVIYSIKCDYYHSHRRQNVDIFCRFNSVSAFHHVSFVKYNTS